MAIDSQQLVRVLTSEYNRLGAYVWSITGDSSLCDDVLQEVALLAIEKGGEVADEPRLKVWLRRAARLKAMEALRQKKRSALAFTEETMAILEEDWQPYDEQTQVTDSSLIELLQACMGILADNHRRILHLRYGVGLRSGEIADQLGMTARAVYRVLTRSHRSLADCVRERLAAMRKATCDD
jgi:RNA polymerase sigma-70 factor, ECF subfamily